MQRAYDFLKKAGTYYLATTDGDQPHVRPFGTANIYDGKLYITTDQGIREKTMIAVDLETGHAEPVFTRCTGRLDAEGEGIAIYPYADGSLFHIIDVAAQTRITSYKPE